LDENTLRQWIYHPNLKIVDNDVNDFKDKMNMVVKSISSLVETPNP